MYLQNAMTQTLKKLKTQAANMITIGNLAFGGAAIMATVNEYYSFSVLFIFIAGLLDRFDGMVARRFNLESELGKQLDSMSDIISFGIAPALLMYSLVLQNFSVAGMIITVIYIACGAFRLARFNISESNGFFTGLPITVAGVILTLSYFAIDLVPPVTFMFLFIILALLMISTFTLRKV
ncbi:CDP-diacylglycerol--serine O-phosphatidyltransferase [Psychrobacillus sp. FSL K6-2684]|uniref:CDP-diacylglycerol--serine O-phosphatidyltransferase n=1 Tax=Psychrobacillus faecigallinarum TaxID=2762235 RepID=A0ABR8R7L8_9BACI|nr:MULTISPECIES: CDP-diacylglycerol--serine O-phosphatidyltransferase [Psychrobacillus]MBD7943800.1 CDP-diacylglycerol--serine O-phosphatidyltransferase [Psychrobacillus faecigallinarum]QEY19312.1 CDP-diacylglycerol--serine O-phosphatidyltransferase [Psychrobacillus sp. AK 1817]QGM29803.1 CDP-diacylglycerol--serine O-phosphatidyltransferase [Bacillus sp. N3536]